jgi:transposase InsO family protein
MTIGRDQYFTLLRQNNLLVKMKRLRVRTTDSYHRFHKYPNLIKTLEPTRANILWVSDITYIRAGNGFHYLSLITDAYSRKIIGWKLADTMEAIHSVAALKMAINESSKITLELIHHSDRGIQYCCDKYVQTLNKYNIGISMTENGDPRENAIAERVNGILKTEWIDDIQLTDNLSNNQEIIRGIIHLYNTERPHMSIQMLTPQAAHSGEGVLKRLWKQYYRNEKQDI